MKILFQFLLYFVILSSVANSSNIRFLDYNFDPIQFVPDSEHQIIETTAGNSLHFVQFNGNVKQQWLDELKSSNIELLQYYPDNTYLVWGNTSQLSSIESQNHVRWVGGFAQAYRKNPNLKGRTGRINNIDIHFYVDDTPEPVITTIKNMGAEVLNHYPAQPDKKIYDAIVQLDSDKIDLLTTIPQVISVAYIGEKPILDDESSSGVVAGYYDMSNVPYLNYTDWLTNVGLDGTGVIWSITDTGVDYDHPDLNTRIVGGFTYPGCTASNPGDDAAGGGHGTHVAGITGGDATSGFTDGDGYLYGLGVAPNYSIFAQNPICSGSASWPPAGGWQVLTKNALLGGAIGSNNSWTSGEGTAHGYQSTERTHDFMAKDGNFDTAGVAEEFMLVFSAGNSGPGSSTLTAPKEAKNVIVTAGTQTYRVSGNIDAMYNSSSRGPAVDGRFVPTIAAPGQSVGSTRNDEGGSCGTAIANTNGLYSFCTGTSMAAPHTSGSLVLISQWWRQNNAGANPSAAMAKALLINTAYDISGAGPIPNFDEGWGRIKLDNLFESVTPFEFYDQQTILDNTGEMWEASVGVVDTNKPLKVTLVWSDAPGAIGANPALVNNLDLEVDNGGVTYLGNSFSGGTSVAGGSPDNINNMENVFLNAPGGSAIIRVKATNIAGDGVFFSGDITDQNFAIVCSNCAAQPDFTLNASPREVSVCSPDNANLNINIGSILAFNNPVTLGVSSTPAGGSSNFTVNPVTPLPGSSILTISNTNSISPGTYPFDLQATSTTGMKTLGLTMNVFDSVPQAVTLTSPTNNSTLINTLPTLEWSAVTQANTYTVEVDDNSDFSSIEYSATTADITHTLTAPLNTSTVYYWRVTVENECGNTQSSVFSFTTEPAPGDCPLVATPITHFEDDVESGANGWTHSGTQDTWQIDTTNPYGGSGMSWHAEDPTSVSDQRLVSPAVILPVGQNPLTLSYQNHQTIEDNAPNCWDGGILEISTDGGSNWTYLEDSKMLTDNYTGTFSGTANPLTGQDFLGWCGDPQDWTKSVVDLNDYAGQTVQFRFRLGSDGSVGRTAGWVIDNIEVKSCQYQDLIFENGFENLNP
ncbi:MAG TPA: S8 family serine peptidase [Gammaproteobacteria bacterium]|nr:S8 family serine peptidase [Gammaproteobacteria bacterium]HPI94842.1 S8 family serine peptidase [Gammaproteobacteria bacterium]HPQ86435.1 S8 family serine peptidase [Gammaproteobacteria bacterium]